MIYRNGWGMSRAGSGEKHVPQTLYVHVFATKNRPASLQSGVEKTLVEPGQYTHISGRLRAFVGSIAQADVGEHDFDEIMVNSTAPRLSDLPKTRRSCRTMTKAAYNEMMLVNPKLIGDNAKPMSMYQNHEDGKPVTSTRVLRFRMGMIA